jgi:hypothetical protein
MIEHRAFFGDGEKTFALPAEQIFELERITGATIGAVWSQFMALQPGFANIMAVIRLGMIGGGASPKDAAALVDAYAKPTPIMESFQLAFDILAARWNGTAPEARASQEAVAPGDLAAAIHEAYADVPA